MTFAPEIADRSVTTEEVVSNNVSRARAGLEAVGVSKFYTGVPALQDANIVIRPGQIVGLAGHNGAGKSTLLKILSGVLRPDTGSVMIDGEVANLYTPSVAIGMGISTVHQELSLLANLSVAQNTFLAKERTRLGWLQRESMRREAQEMVDRFGLDIDVTLPVGEFSVATRQLLELAIATHRKARFLLLDEPTTSLEGEQIAPLLATIRKLAKEEGVGILLIDHKLDELYAVSDHLVALVDGHVRINKPATEVPRAEIVRAITGDDAIVRVNAHGDEYIAPEAGKSHSTIIEIAAKPALHVRHLKTSTLRDVSLQVGTGKILGIYGLVGSGRTEFLHALIGIDRVYAGAIELYEKRYIPRNPADARRHGIVYLTEERKQDGIIPPLDARVNVSLPILNQFARLGFLNLGSMYAHANDFLDTLSVRGDRLSPVTRLSGGNQQKVLLARALAQDPRILLLDEPTKGVDIGVKSDIHRMIRDLAHEQGLTVLLVSSEEEEILELADDVVVFVSGSCSGDATRASELTAAQIRKLAWVSE